MVASLGNCASPGMIVGRFPPYDTSDTNTPVRVRREPAEVRPYGPCHRPIGRRHCRFRRTPEPGLPQIALAGAPPWLWSAASDVQGCDAAGLGSRDRVDRAHLRERDVSGRHRPDAPASCSAVRLRRPLAPIIPGPRNGKPSWQDALCPSCRESAVASTLVTRRVLSELVADERGYALHRRLLPDATTVDHLFVGEAAVHVIKVVSGSTDEVLVERTGGRFAAGTEALTVGGRRRTETRGCRARPERGRRLRTGRPRTRRAAGRPRAVLRRRPPGPPGEAPPHR